MGGAEALKQHVCHHLTVPGDLSNSDGASLVWTQSNLREQSITHHRSASKEAGSNVQLALSLHRQGLTRPLLHGQGLLYSVTKHVDTQRSLQMLTSCEGMRE